MSTLARVSFLLPLCALAGCDACYDQCTVPTEDELAALPASLRDTGLFAADSTAAAEVLGDGVRAYTPAFALWSDGADKRRWIAVPEGKHIDTHDMDDWRFPRGTKLWKEFVRDGVRVETRLMLNTGDDNWVAAAYVWNDDDSDATLAPDGEVDAHRTHHDVPAADQCLACHGGRKSFVLGFSAVQLANGDDPHGFDDLLSEPLHDDLIVPGNATERAALGYLHANCSHCHNQDRPETDGPRCYDPRNELDMFLTKSALGAGHDVADTHTYKTVVHPGGGRGDGGLVKPGHPDDSALLHLVQTREAQRGGGFGPSQMPPLATELVDADGTKILRRWVDAL
jgi:hypothetical protein